MQKPPTLLDDFATWLESSKFETLLSDIRLLRYLQELPRAESTKLTVRQLGTRLTLQHDGLGARGTVMLPNVSMRLQSALIDWTLGKRPEHKRELTAQAAFAQPSIPSETF